MGNIDWLPIEDLPEEFKDGREVLLWGSYKDTLWVGQFSEGEWHERWGGGALGGSEITHFAEINAPA